VGEDARKMSAEAGVDSSPEHNPSALCLNPLNHSKHLLSLVEIKM